ncbi:hypothetical protein [uncultured Methanolobus sp.]|uniref:hypothetical protein n=1 Tax=uncultured Methanolobus sp. TaxID=218300 RepID=UPI002AAB9325|nr:hypothetical protein [uncultured Methanolobus sp.]
MKIKQVNTDGLIAIFAGGIIGTLCYCIYGLVTFYVLFLINIYLNIDSFNTLTLWLVTGPLIIFMISGQYLLIGDSISEFERIGSFAVIKGSIIGFCLWFIVTLLTYLFSIGFIPISNTPLMIVYGYSIMATMSLISLYNMKKWVNVEQFFC